MSAKIEEEEEEGCQEMKTLINENLEITLEK